MAFALHPNPHPTPSPHPPRPTGLTDPTHPTYPTGAHRWNAGMDAARDRRGSALHGGNGATRDNLAFPIGERWGEGRGEVTAPSPSAEKSVSLSAAQKFPPSLLRIAAEGGGDSEALGLFSTALIRHIGQMLKSLDAGRRLDSRVSMRRDRGGAR